MTLISDELSPSSTTVWERPVRKAFIQDRVLPLAPCWWILCNSFIWFTLSNALLKSSKTRSVCRPWEVLRASSSTSWMSWVSQDRLSQKPCWRSYRISFEPPVMRKPILPYANNKGTDQPAHPHSLISTFVVRCLDSIIPLVSISEISRL